VTARSISMTRCVSVTEYLHSLKNSPRLGHLVVYHKEFPPSTQQYAEPGRPWHGEIVTILQRAGIRHLYRHQVEATDAIRAGKNVVVATPTASGKTLIYNLPVFERLLCDPHTHALYLFPLKALAQDQLKTFERMALGAEQIRPTAAIYDGDTPSGQRRRLRASPPNLLITNPEMLHLALLPYHHNWSSFFARLAFVVVDELHTYRGVMGSHMALVFARLLRVCSYHGVRPVFVLSSATIANPEQLAVQLTGLPVQVVAAGTAPRGRHHVVFVNPDGGAVQTAILLLKAALHRGLRTIVYTQSRRLTELIAMWVHDRGSGYASRIHAYRAGYLPEERREIEAGLADGRLLAVVATSALELGIDIGNLDLCLLVGYPGTIMATWQRAGRVGRGMQESAVVLVAGQDALDQYFMRNPEDFFNRSPESAVINPTNPVIVSRHLVCAACELPLEPLEPLLAEPAVCREAQRLEGRGELLRDEQGERLYAARRQPHREVDLRGAGKQFHIVDGRCGDTVGQIDGFRAFRETHPGAVYLHMGRTYVVRALDVSGATVSVSEMQVDYHTRVRTRKSTEILERQQSCSVWGTRVHYGRLRVTDQVTGYEKRHTRTGRVLQIVPLKLAPNVFETEGFWVEVPLGVQQALESKNLHFMGAIHAMEHAAIGILPLLVMTDRNDLGGISTPFHPQVGCAAVFIHDAVPGGVGLSRLAFHKARDLLVGTREAVASCPCSSGCPSCVHSPRCGSGNRPIDKAACLYLLEALERGAPVRPKGEADAPVGKVVLPEAKPLEQPPRPVHYGVLDIETQRSFEEVGGWHRADLMGLSCAVFYDSRADAFFEYLEQDVPALLERLGGVQLVVGFNIKRFDFRVLGGYTGFDFSTLPCCDILEEVHNYLGYRLSLDHLAAATLGARKSADGLQALRWWKEGKIEQIKAYCRKDVALTRDLYLYGKNNRYLLFNNKAGNKVRVPVSW